MSALQSKDTIEINSSSFVLSLSKFITSNFFVDEECAEKWRDLNTKPSFPNGLQAIVMLISWIAWVRSLCMTRVQVEGDFLGWLFGPKRLTYTRVNTVLCYSWSFWSRPNQNIHFCVRNSFLSKKGWKYCLQGIWLMVLIVRADNQKKD